jgi:putative tricarboxylic transport membrane protein
MSYNFAKNNTPARMGAPAWVKTGRQPMTIDRIIAIAAILFVATYFYATQQIELLDFGDPIGPRMFPYLTGAIFLIGAVILMFETFQTSKATTDDLPPPPPTQLERHATRRVYWMVAAVSAWSLLYIFAFERVGYVPASIVFLLGLTCYFHPRKWMVNAAISILLPVVTYVVFHNLLHVSLPAGLLSL